jgi:RNA recognition motif-containing protein
VKYLWIGGISTSVTKEELEKEFSKYGEIERFLFLRNRNSAMVDYATLEDAISAHKSLNGKVLGGEELCVDFQRSQTLRRVCIFYYIASLSCNCAFETSFLYSPP